MPPKKVKQASLFAYKFKRSATSEKSGQSITEHDKHKSPSVEADGACEVQNDSVGTGAPNTMNTDIPESDIVSGSSDSSTKTCPPKKAKSDKEAKEYHFQKSWYTYPDGSERQWLKYDEQMKIMTCEYCIELYQNQSGGSSMTQRGGTTGSSFILGCSTLRYTSVLAHEKAANHQKACEAYFAKRAAPFKTPIGKGFRKMDEKELEKRKFQFVTALYLAQQELPLSHFQPLLALQDKNFNANLCSNYANEKQCKYFIEYIAEVLRNEIAEMLKRNDLFSVLNDSSSDSGVNEQEVVYARTLNETCEPVTTFLAIKKLAGGDATSIKQAVINSIEDDGNCPDWRDRLVSCTVDGASVMTGRLNGMVKQVQEDVPHLIGIHCTDIGSPISKVVSDGAKLLESIKQEIDRRFESMALRNKSVLKSFSHLFEPKRWPVDKTEYSTYGDEELEVLQGHYGSLLDKKGYDGSLATLRNEMTELMLTVSILHQPTYRMTFRMWSPFLVMNKSQDVQTLKNILALLRIYMVIPSSTAEAERGFSLMQRIKNDHRSRLSGSTLTDLMMVKLCAPDLDSFDPVPSISMWYTSGKRRLQRRRSTMSKVAQAALSTPEDDSENDSEEDAENQQTQSDPELM